MFILLHLFVVLIHDLLPFLGANRKGIFLNWIDFASHRAFICCYIIRLKKQSISRNLHSLVNGHNITHKDEVLVNLKSKPTAPH
jgi:hypothetical protein